MTDIVEYPLEGSGSVLVAVDAIGGDIVTRGWADDRAGKVAIRTADTFEAALASVRPATKALLRSFADLDTTPKEIKAEFGIGLTAGADAFIAQIGSSANFKVTLTWSPDQ